MATMVRESGASSENTGAFGSAELAVVPRFEPLVAKRCQENSASSEVNALPLTGGLLWNFTDGRETGVNDWQLSCDGAGHLVAQHFDRAYGLPVT